jgi:hypothetical protein
MTISFPHDGVIGVDDDSCSLSEEQIMNRWKRFVRRITGRREPTLLFKSPSLRERVELIWGGWIVQVRVVEEGTDRPLEGALVELNSVAGRDRGLMHASEMVSVSRSASPEIHLQGRSDPRGFVVFGLPLHPPIMYLDMGLERRNVYVVSAEAEGHEVCHREISYGSQLNYHIVHVFMEGLDSRGCALATREVDGFQPDEEVVLALPPAVGF